MPVLFIIPALFLPRVAIVLLWLFSAWFSVVQNGIYLLIGFLFLPYTLLWYSAVEHWYAGTWGPLQMVVLVIAVLVDLGVTGSGKRHYHRGDRTI